MIAIRSFALGVAILAMACGGESLEPKSAALERTPAQTPAQPSAQPLADANRALVKRFMEDVWVRKDIDAATKYVAADLVNHAAIPSAQGAAGLQTIARKVQKAFPDLQVTVDSIATDGDIVIVRASFDGTHKDTLEFQKPLEATGKHMHIDQVHTYRIKDGRIAETWMVMDRLDFMAQLGVAPGK